MLGNFFRHPKTGGLRTSNQIKVARDWEIFFHFELHVNNI